MAYFWGWDYSQEKYSCFILAIFCYKKIGTPVGLDRFFLLF